MLRRFGTFLQTRASNLVTDYATAFREAGVEMKEKPFKAAFYLTSLTAAGILIYHRPSMRDFGDQVILAEHKLGDLPNPRSRSKSSFNHIKRILDARDTKRLRYVNLGVFALIVERPVDSTVCNAAILQSNGIDYTYKTMWKEFQNRTIDIGIYNRWLVLEKKMVDYDVNDDEYTRL